MLNPVIQVEQFRGDGANPGQRRDFEERLNPIGSDRENIVIIEVIVSPDADPAPRLHFREKLRR